MKDEVLDLLATFSPQPANNLTPNYQKMILTSPNLTLSLKNELLNQKNFIEPVSNQLPSLLGSDDFEKKIKELELKAKEFKDENHNLSPNPIKLNNSISQKKSNKVKNDLFKNKICLQSPKRSVSTTNLLIPTCMTQSFNSNSNNFKNEDIYLKDIKDKLEIQLKETEYLKKELKTTNQIEFDCQSNNQINQFIAQPQQIINKNVSNDSDRLIDQLIDLKFKLKESINFNEELKKSFKENLDQYQKALKECVEDKDNLIGKKDEKIRELEEEAEKIRRVLEKHENLFKENESFEELAQKIKCYQDLLVKLHELLLTEEKKREKNYFDTDSLRNLKEKSGEKVNCVIESLLKGIMKCLDDYQGEIKHSKIIIKELQNSWEKKDKEIDEKEHELNEQFNKKCETIRQEYDRMISLKQTDINKLQNQIEDLNNEIYELKEKNRKSIDNKDIEINNLKLNNEKYRLDYEIAQKELNHLKTRFDNMRSKEKENQNNFNKTLSKLESDNLELNNKCLDLSKELSETQTKSESIKTQLGKYEQLIDNLNDQVIFLKRELKENQFNQTQLNHKYEIEIDIKNKLDHTNQQLEKQVNELKDQLSKHENCNNEISNLKDNISELKSSLNKKSIELGKLTKKFEQTDQKSEGQSELIIKLNEEKSHLECDIEKLKIELNDSKIKLQNSSCLIQQTYMTNTLLKEEKESLESILRDNAIKLKSIKNDFDRLNENNLRLEAENTSLKNDNDFFNKKMIELKKLNDILTNEKTISQKELNQTKNELATSQTSFKNLNKKLTQTINDKDNHIAKLEQSISLYEKEISLLKQVETLQKNQEDSKVIELANTVQLKLAQKKNKIECLKAKINSLESSNEILSKEKNQIESELKSSNSKNESLEKDNKKMSNDLEELKVKISSYERALEKASKRFTECEKRNESLKNEIIKLKKFLKTNLIEEPVKEKCSNDNECQSNNDENSIAAINKFISMILTTKSKINSNPELANNQVNLNNENNENFFANLRKVLETSIDLEQTTLSNNCNKEGFESNQILCDNLENKLIALNNLGQTLKKENNEVIQLLLQQPKFNSND